MKPLALQDIVNLNIANIITTHGGGEDLSLSVEEIASHISVFAPCNMNMKAPYLEYLFLFIIYFPSYNVFTETFTDIK